MVAFAAAKPTDPHVAVSQDTSGNYKFAVNLNGQSRTEQATADGTLRGSYTFIDGNGVQQTVEYTAGPDGFQATGNHLPVAPEPIQETEEVAKARALHLAALKA